MSRPSPFRCLAFTAIAVAIFGISVPSFADPPPWAPAHGWRAKQHKHKHDRREVYVRPAYVVPYGISDSTCHRDLIGAAIGGAAGGVLGSQVGKGDGRTVATVGGVLIGVLVGGAVGRSMDNADQACASQIMEYAEDRQPVVWSNGHDQYQVVPARTFQSAGQYCREYRALATIGGRERTTYGTACRQPDGSWRLQN